MFQSSRLKHNEKKLIHIKKRLFKKGNLSFLYVCRPEQRQRKKIVVVEKYTNLNLVLKANIIVTIYQMIIFMCFSSTQRQIFFRKIIDFFYFPMSLQDFLNFYIENSSMYNLG